MYKNIYEPIILSVIISILAIACAAQDSLPEEAAQITATPSQTTIALQAIKPTDSPELQQVELSTPISRDVAVDPYPSPPYPPPPPDYTPPAPRPTLAPIARCPYTLPENVTMSEMASSLFTFSPPVAIPFAEEIHGSIDILDWFPDNQSILVIAEGQSSHPIFRVNSSTGATTRLAEQNFYTTSASWMSLEQGVIFTDKEQADLWTLKFSQNMSATAESWASPLGSVYLSVHPTSQEVGVLLPGYPPVPAIVNESRETQNLTSRLIASDYHVNAFTAAKLAWSPNAENLVHFGTSGAYLFTSPDSSECALDFGKGETFSAQWGIQANWSSDGRYIAMIVAKGTQRSLPYDRSDLLIIDTESETMRFLAHPTVNWDIVTGIGWHPTSNHLLVKVRGSQSEVNGFPAWQDDLYLLDANTLEIQSILPNTAIHHGGASKNIAWSPNGNSIAFVCTGFPLCLISVSQQ